MPSVQDRLAAGLEAQDWRETAGRGPWRRFAKFGRGAMYVFYPEQRKENALWFSELHQTQPQHPVVGPILVQVLAAGDLVLGKVKPDTEGMLIELMYIKEKSDGS